MTRFDHCEIWASLHPIDRWLLCFVAFQDARKRPARVSRPKAWEDLVAHELVDIRLVGKSRVATLTERGRKLHYLATRDVLPDTEEWTDAASADPGVLPAETPAPKTRAKAKRPGPRVSALLDAGTSEHTVRAYLAEDERRRADA